jgi:UDP-GlcNAc:undecaprenyl-phosphate GlcNAc-1-phosphate transferase
LRGVSPFSADRQHFHHLLLDAGLNQRQAVLVVYAVVAVFGMVALSASSMVKLIGFGVLVCVMILAMGGLFLRDLHQRRSKS